jgi:5-(aminomethyl)-3-furanmethanol phosphate kinase
VTPLVIKIGGGLLGIQGALKEVCAAVGTVGRSEAVVVVPGGGPLADLVRDLDRTVGLSADASHWMAILAMDQYAHLLAERIEGARLVEEPGAIPAVLGAGRVAVLAPSRWLRAADPLPHSWDATSDSVAAFVAGALDAKRLVLVKPVEVGRDGVDRCFVTVVPAGLEVTVVGWERFTSPRGMRELSGASAPSLRS